MTPGRVLINTVGMHGLRAFRTVDVDTRLGYLDAEVLLQAIQARPVRTGEQFRKEFTRTFGQTERAFPTFCNGIFEWPAGCSNFRLRSAGRV